jgi:hypothetical protein
MRLAKYLINISMMSKTFAPTEYTFFPSLGPGGGVILCRGNSSTQPNEKRHWMAPDSWPRVGSNKSYKQSVRTYVCTVNVVGTTECVKGQKRISQVNWDWDSPSRRVSQQQVNRMEVKGVKEESLHSPLSSLSLIMHASLWLVSDPLSLWRERRQFCSVWEREE